MMTIQLIYSEADLARTKPKTGWDQVQDATWSFMQEFAKNHGVAASRTTLHQLLTQPTVRGPHLLVSSELETVVYAQQIQFPCVLDGSTIVSVVGDKYATYSRIKQTSLLQPETVVVRSQSDLIAALQTVKTKKVVLKPRYYSYESQNIYLIHRERLQQIASDERLNFKNYILQSYNDQTIWPPVEWRFHYVGQTLCRCLRTVDKNNWLKQFGQLDIALSDIPESYVVAANTAARALVSASTHDNMTIDFLEMNTGSQLLFLEANCGVLNSFMLMTEVDVPALTRIYQELLKQYSH